MLKQYLSVVHDTENKEATQLVFSSYGWSNAEAVTANPHVELCGEITETYVVRDADIA